MQSNLTEKQAYWLSHVRLCEESGQSMRAYANEAGLSVVELYSWKATLRRKGILGDNKSAPTHLFRKAEIVDGRHLGRCRITLPSGTVLDIEAGTEPNWIARLISALSHQ